MNPANKAAEVRTAFVFAAVFTALLVSGSRVVFDPAEPPEGVSLLVRIDFPGAFEAEVERTLAVPLENALSGVPGIVGMVSSSRRDGVRMLLAFSGKTDETEAYLEVREKIFSLEHRFPPGVRRPVISRGDPEDRPVFTSAFPEAPGLSPDELKRLFEAVEGSGEVLVAGGIRREIHVRVDPAVTPDFFPVARAVRNAAASGSFGRPGGAVLRMGGRPRSAGDVENIRPGPAARLRDLAETELAAAERTDSARLDARDVLILSVRREGGADTAALCGRLRRLAESFPGGVVLYDRGEGVREEFLRILRSGCAGTAAAGILAAIFLRRPVAVLAVALNLAFSAAAALAALAAGGFSLDVMSMSGIAAGSAAVVARGFLAEGLYSAGEEIRGPLVISALVPAAAFFPLLFASPDLVRRFSGCAAASAAQTAASLAFIFLFRRALPRLSDRPRAGAPFRLPRRPEAAARAVFRLFAFRWAAAAAALFLLPCAAALLLLRGNALPAGRGPGNDILSFAVEFEGGCPLSRIESACRPLEEKLRGLAGVARVWSSLERERARFDVQLADPSFRAAVRAAAGDFSAAIPDGFLHFPGDRDAAGSFEVLVTGPDRQTLRTAAAGLAREIGLLPGVRGILLHYKEAPSEKVAAIDPAAARRLGVTPADAAERLRWALSGPVAEKIFLGDEETDLRVMAVPRAVDTAARILDFPVPAADGGIVRIGDFARIGESEQCGTITRTNRSRSASFTVLAEDGGANGPRKAARRLLAAHPFPPGYSAAAPAAGESGASPETAAAVFFLALPLAALVLVFHYGNLRAPCFVLAQAPLCAAAALLPSILRDSPLTAPAALGAALAWGATAMISLPVIPRGRARPRYAEGSIRRIAAASLLSLAGILPLAFAGNEAAPLAEALAAGTAASPLALAAAAALALPRRRENGATGPGRPGRFSGLPWLPGRRRPRRPPGR